MKNIRGYNFSRPFMGERVPQHIQNIVIKDYCIKNNLNFLLSVTEYSVPNSYFILNDLLKNISNMFGIVAYSLFQMPENDLERKKFFNKILKKRKKIFFACENLKLQNKADIETLENIWLVKKITLKK
tara:strand:+ start:2956 stop:3339 length:384 start_codon:yes stop_codon:yes gene_type:complete